uniref:ATP-dependent Clp protease proteolytic subunit n=1 Tax=Beaumontia murtonii TaxID=2066938 RepID=A0A2S1UAA2_9GENT|nr:Clp protease proteolytic subunit [Beaumontia murtonii]
MPIGVPKVPFRIWGEEEASWVDLYNRLYRNRVLFLGQEVDSEIANQIVGLMVYLSIEDYSKDQYLLINSPGGWVIPGLGIYDTMQYIPPDVHTICIGLAASMGSCILVGGAFTKRLAFPHARVMMHQPVSSYSEIETGNFILEAGELLTLRDNLARIYSQRTGKPSHLIIDDMERDFFMTSTEAQAYGIIDSVASEL